jgi:hypothetical protein
MFAGSEHANGVSPLNSRPRERGGNVVRALNDADNQTLRDLVEKFRASRTAVTRSENFEASGGPGEQKYNNYRAVYKANAANLKHFLDERPKRASVTINSARPRH